MKWLEKLSKAIEYIEQNLDKDVTVEEAAKIVSCSTYYFQKIFTIVVEISFSEYIRRRRMTLAAFELQTKDTKVMDVAFKYGYESPTSFNRAFQSVHGVSPSAARKKGTNLSVYPPISFAITVRGNEKMKYKIVKKDAFRAVGIRMVLKDDMEYNQSVVPKFWNDTISSCKYEEICKLSNSEPNGILGITSYEGDEGVYYYIATSTDKEKHDYMVEIEIPSATWVVFECYGGYKESVQNIFKRFLTEWLPASGYEYAQLPDIEVYPHESNELKSGNTQVWIAINKKEGV